MASVRSKQVRELVEGLSRDKLIDGLMGFVPETADPTLAGAQVVEISRRLRWREGRIEELEAAVARVRELASEWERQAATMRSPDGGGVNWVGEPDEMENRALELRAALGEIVPGATYAIDDPQEEPAP